MAAPFTTLQLPDPEWLANPKNFRFLLDKQEERDRVAAKAKAKAGFDNNKENQPPHQENVNARSHTTTTTTVHHSKRRGSEHSGAVRKKPRHDDDDDDGGGGGADLSGIQLPGENDDDGEEQQSEGVEVYETCDEVRRKIHQHLSARATTKAAFLRRISAAAYADAPKIQSKQLDDFLGKDGPGAGASSRVFYAAYVYFEKLRVRNGGEKSQHRRDMEAEWRRQGGFERKRPRGYHCHASTDRYLYEDNLGRVHLVRGDDPEKRDVPVHSGSVEAEDGERKKNKEAERVQAEQTSVPGEG